MQGYEEIFAKRGTAYHQAMEQYPEARSREFELAVSFLAAEPKSTILDIPAGGGYLQKFLTADINYLAYDFSGEFDDHHSGVKKCKESEIDLPDEAVNEAVSLAAMHHVVERSLFFAEMYRVLKKGGRLVIADVLEGSAVDPFLNVFLNDWNSMGHKGVFLRFERDKELLAECGFSVTAEFREFPWIFNDSNQAKNYFRKLFFLDLDPSDEQLQEALDRLGVEEKQDSYLVRWSLGFLVATKN